MSEGYRNLKGPIPSIDSLLRYSLALVVGFSLWSVGVSARDVQTRENANRVGMNMERRAAAYERVKHASKEPEFLARVNGEPVTGAELKHLLADSRLRWRLTQELNIENPGSQELRRLAVQKLIHRRLFLQEAGRQRITVSSQELDQAIFALRNRFADLASFGMWMEERNLNDRLLFETIRTDLLVNRVAAWLVADVEISEQQVQDYYRSHREDLAMGEEVRLRIIVVNSSAAAQEILTDLRKGENFSHLAQTRSLGLRAFQGGDTGWVNTRTLTPPLREAVALLRVGEASHPLQKDVDEFLIVGLAGRRPARARRLDAARPVIKQRLLAAKQQDIIRTWLTEQENKSIIELFPQPNDSPTGSGKIQNADAESVLQAN